MGGWLGPMNGCPKREKDDETKLMNVVEGARSRDGAASLTGRRAAWAVLANVAKLAASVAVLASELRDLELAGSGSRILMDALLKAILMLHVAHF